VHAFWQAERTAPLRARLHPQVRAALLRLFDRPHHRSTGHEPRGLAERCGLLGA
jgi:hypothetical protein